MDMITRAIGPDAAPAGQVCPANSHNEWDPLEEVSSEGSRVRPSRPLIRLSPATFQA
jgi:glycine amidinotransferase